MHHIRPALIEAAIAAHTPIQTVAIHGTGDLLEKPLVRKRGARVHAHFGPVRRDFASPASVGAMLARADLDGVNREMARRLRPVHAAVLADLG